MRSLGIPTLWVAATLLAAAAAAGGCGGGGSSGTASTATAAGGASSSTGTHATSSSTAGTGGAGTTTSSSSATTTSTTSANGGAGTGGSAPVACTTAATGQLRGSAIALTSDDKTLLAVNRDAGTVSVLSVDYTSGQPAMTLVKELTVGAEPWQVVIDGCDATAYVVLRKDQKVVEITGVGTATPAVGRSVAVGSEPTGLALTPHNTKLYVSNWVDGTLSVVNPVPFTATTIDLNATIAATGLLGPDVMAAPRASLAHPRAVAITNSGGADDSVETVYVTEWFAVRTAPESTAGTAADINWKGLLYKVPVGTGTPSTIDLPPVGNTAADNTGFNDAKGQLTGCFPNQVASVTLDGNGFAYVTSTCASPAGPTGVFQKGACGLASQCPTGPNVAACVNGACNNSCTQDSDCGVGSAAGACNLTGNAGGGVCAPLAANAKTTTHPGLTVVDLGASTAVTTNLDASFVNKTLLTSGTVSTRMPLLPTDIDFHTGGFGYVASEGADALFRLTFNASGAIIAAGSATNDFIDVRTTANAAVHLPIGVVVSRTGQAFAFVNNDGTRDVVAIDLGTQAVSASATADVQSTALPAANSPEASQLNGKRFFNTGLGRWSLSGAAWGSCGACHVDGLTDNVTWYFARGPRQTTSLDGTFSKTDATDQRLLNWSAINDEISDFEGNVRGISGGVGAIVSTVSTPPVNTDRINTFASTPSQQGLQGSSDATALSGASPVNTNWADITHWIQTIRSPRAPTNLVTADVTAGAALFGAGQGNCTGCHSGAKWTISKRFYAPGDTPNDAFTAGAAAAESLSGESWLAAAQAAKFPAALFPSTTATKQTMRSGAPPTFEQIQCILRPVGTIGAVAGGVPAGVSPAAVDVQEVRQDMATGAQGAGGINASDFTEGFNPPSLLGLQVGAPYFHAGNARSLEELFNDTLFHGHHRSPVAQVFTPTATQVKQLVAFLLSIDGNTTTIPIPAASASGGDICSYN
jgi:hypothetical protein